MSAIEVIEFLKHCWRGQGSAMRRWGATVTLIVLLTPLRILNLCVVAMIGVAAFLGSSPIGQFLTRPLSHGTRLTPLRIRHLPGATDVPLRRPS